jgi:hypothetical protein
MNAAAQHALTGFVSRLPAETYHSLPGLSISRLKELQRSAKHYRYRLTNPKQTNPLRLGTAAHCAVLEPERFSSEFAAWGRRAENGNLCPRKGQYWDAFVAANPGRTLITEDERDRAHAIAAAVRADPAAMRYLETGEPEVTMQWELEVNSMVDGSRTFACRARADWLTRVDGEHYVVGLKTARDCRPFIFGNAAAKLGYTLQWSWYQDGYRTLTGVTPKMREIVVESEPPYDVVVNIVPEDALEQGRADYQALLVKLIQCETRNEWFGVAEGKEQILTLPTWAYDSTDDIGDLGLEQ